MDSRPLHWALRTGQREGLWIAYRLVTMETVRYLPAQALPRGALVGAGPRSRADPSSRSPRSHAVPQLTQARMHKCGVSQD